MIHLNILLESTESIFFDIRDILSIPLKFKIDFNKNNFPVLVLLQLN